MSKPSSTDGASGRHLHHHVADDFSNNSHPSSQTHHKRQAKQGHNHGHHPRSDRVDVLFGLDVLQDWEAEICMGPKKSITLKTKRSMSRGSAGSGSGSSVVVPFASPAKSI